MVNSQSDIIRAYFAKHPGKLSGNFGKTARELGSTYNLVHKIATKIKQDGLAVEALKSVSSTDTNDDGYEDIADLQENNSLRSYCAAYGIPYEYVTSAKFVNHQFQEVWNVVCDTTQLTPAYLDIYFDKLKEALSGLIEPTELPGEKLSNEAAYHFYQSDKHVAARTKKNSVYKNTYNAEVFEARMMETLKDYQLEAEVRGHFDKVLVSDLGDAADGWNGGTTRSGKGSSHTLPQNLDNCETFDVYVAATCRFFDKLVDMNLANEIEFIAVSNDNHGGAFSYIVNRGVEIYLNLRYPQIKTQVSRQFITKYEYGIHTFLLTHGKDEEEMKFGWPLNLSEKVVSWLEQYIRKNKIHSDYVHVIKGDLHQENMNLHESLRYRNCLSMYGSSAWSMMNYGFTNAGSSYEVVYKNHQKISAGYILFDQLS